MNVDGKKTVGMFYPSSEAQENLMVMAYDEAGIDPLKLTYFEAHCTGTKVNVIQNHRID
jgi:acyl transferase domain-containing protein